jgi:O-antigen/teichoic acid export membrane protein
MWRQWRDGFHFSLLSASSIASQITTPMVGLLSDLATAGIYAAAIRIVEAAIIPFYAFTFSTISRFFRVGVGGAHESRKLAVRLLPGGLVTSFFGSICVVLFAPLGPRLLGQGFAATGPVMMILAILPVVYSVYLLAADVLISSRYVGSRVLLQCILPLLNVAFCGLLVPRFGAAGAAVAVLISNTIMASAAWILVLMVSPKSAPAETDLTS